MRSSLVSRLALVLSLLGGTVVDGKAPDYGRILPPKPTHDLSSDQQDELHRHLAEVTLSFQAVKSHRRAADIEIFLKAVRFALEFHEWYDKNPDDGARKARALLDEAAQRIAHLKKDQTPWLEGSGQKVFGFYSTIDGSAQPYGVEIPDGLVRAPNEKTIPIWVWLHGRADTTTDLKFIHTRLTAKKPGQFRPEGAIVIHPFGRYCNGWKSAGETDVLEAKNDAWVRFNGSRDGVGPVALAGFSMGGAGAWHLGAHFTNQWSCVHAGAGFVDVRRYQKLKAEEMPPWYERKLWGIYDVPSSARNFLNVPLICYSGEVDKQRDAAEYMLEIFDQFDFQPPHVVGQGMGHEYDKASLEKVQKFIEEAVANNSKHQPRLKVSWQGRTLSYNSLDWVQVYGLKEHWLDSRVDAVCSEDGVIEVSTKNISEIGLVSPFIKSPTDPGPVAIRKLMINGQTVPFQTDGRVSFFRRYRLSDGRWKPWEDRLRGMRPKDPMALTKHPGSTGPIDDAFKSPFLVVLPDLPGSSPVDLWVDSESAHFLSRWRSLMRGDARVMKASEVTAQELEKHQHLILWGTPESNSLIARSIPDLPLSWTSREIRLGMAVADAKDCVPTMIYPNPLSPHAGNYMVLNSGLTFREAHDRTNSLQNPKLPDWAILDISDGPTREAAGKVVAADFFDEKWQPRPRLKPPTDRN